MCSRLALVFDLMTGVTFPRFLFSCLFALSGPTLLRGDAHGQGFNEPRTYSTVTDPKTASAVVATVGPIEITAREFLLSYEFGPAFPKRQQDSKKRYLEFMTYEKLLALEGYRRGLDRSPIARDFLAEIEGDLATEELYRGDVLGQVHVTDAEVEAGVRQEQTTLSLHWLYATTYDGISTIVRSLASGVPFDSLMRLQTDSLSDRSLEETRFQLGRVNPEIAAIADTLRPGIPSVPTQGPDGWYIVLLHNKWTSALPTVSETARLQQIVRKALLSARADSLSDIYVDAVMREHKPVIIRSVMDAMGEFIARRELPGALYEQWGLSNIRVDNVVHQMDTLVTLADGPPFSRADFARWYSTREAVLHFSRTSVDSYFRSLEQFVWRMVRDRLLARKAIARGFQQKESVTMQKRWWEEKILYDLMRSEIEGSISINDSLMQEYFRENRRRYVSTEGDTVSFDRAKEDVRRDIFDRELSKRILHTVLSLKKVNPVTVDTSLIAGLPVDAEHDPRAIDVYPAKTGGIFPRPAFPTIDYRWQAWQ